MKLDPLQLNDEYRIELEVKDDFWEYVKVQGLGRRATQIIVNELRDAAGPVPFKQMRERLESSTFVGNGPNEVCIPNLRLVLLTFVAMGWVNRLGSGERYELTKLGEQFILGEEP